MEYLDPRLEAFLCRKCSSLYNPPENKMFRNSCCQDFQICSECVEQSEKDVCAKCTRSDGGITFREVSSLLK